MQPKPVVITLIILNLILLAVLYLLTQTAILDRWLANKAAPNLCQTQTESGETVFKFCEAEAE
ncbi:MAG: hypothetical protein K9L85_02085 [Candidatus Peribacteraceae bacterium]|nr:hypothetical protein [Candidatus Peribacteraceae bacterium]